MATIFLSHSSRDDALASALEAWLKANGFDDLFVDHHHIRSGDRWTDALRRAKSSCRVVLCLVTPDWLASDECYGEFLAAWYAGRRIIPLLSQAGAELDARQGARLARVLGEDQGADIAAAGAPDALDLEAAPAVAEPLKAGLRAAGALAKVGLDPYAFEVDPDRRREPFPGLESFGDEDGDAAIFFGRGPEIAQCLEDLREMRATGDRRAYAILGSSGSGKSSLLKAGLLPRLRRERGWFVVRAFRSGADPLLNFADAIARTAADLGEPLAPGVVRDALRAAWAAGDDLRAALDAVMAPLKRKADRPAATVLFALDQGEELARADGDGGDALAAFLRAALADPGEGEPAPYALALTVRSDSFAELQAAERFNGLTTRTADIRTLPVHRFAAAVEQPAARYGVEIDPDLVESLIEDAGGKDALPLLAFTLQRLWRQYHSEKRIGRANYESIGKLSGLIEDAAERALRGVDPLGPQGPLDGKVSTERDRRAGRVFVPALAQLNERGGAIRRVARLSGFDEDARELLGHFDRWRLVVKTGELVEVAHEAMFREWPRFRHWLEPEKARLEALRGVESAAAAWAAKGRLADDLTHRGRRLAEARALDRIEDYRLELARNEEARLYLAAATEAERRRRFVLVGGAAGVLAAFLIVLSLLDGAYSDQISHALRVDLYASRGMFHRENGISLTSAERNTLTKDKVRLAAYLAGTIEADQRRNRVVDGWTAAELMTNWRAFKPADDAFLLHSMPSTYLAKNACWIEFDTDPICHTGATAWALRALALSGSSAPQGSLNALLALQNPQGWWPMYANAAADRTNASTYATAWALMAIAAQERFATPAMRARIDLARRKATNWLVGAHEAERYRWKDYPANVGGAVFDSMSALTVAALNEAGLGADLGPLNRGWLRDLPAWPKSIGVLELSNVTLTPASDQEYYDRTRSTVVPWVVVSIFAALKDGDAIGVANAHVYVDRFVQQLGQYGYTTEPEYLTSDFLYGADVLAGAAGKAAPR